MGPRPGGRPGSTISGRDFYDGFGAVSGLMTVLSLRPPATRGTEAIR